MKASKPCSGPGASVQLDWYGWLPDAKLQAFHVYSRDFETCYIMFSVSLDEAIGLRASGSLEKSFQAVDVTPALCLRLTDRLQGLLSSLNDHAKHYGIVPSVEPLDAANFRGVRGQRCARRSSLLSIVLLSQRAQFLSKVISLRGIVVDLSSDFRRAAADLASGCAVDRSDLWTVLDHDHFDLNTCLRESMILLKCFLRVLPDDQLRGFQKTVESHMTPGQRVPERRVLRPRRTPQFAGE